MYDCACAFQALKGNPRHWLLKLPQLRIQRSPNTASRSSLPCVVSQRPDHGANDGGNLLRLFFDDPETPVMSVWRSGKLKMRKQRQQKMRN
jgi:hypothetical protein